MYHLKLKAFSYNRLIATILLSFALTSHTSIYAGPSFLTPWKCNEILNTVKNETLFTESRYNEITTFLNTLGSDEVTYERLIDLNSDISQITTNTPRPNETIKKLGSFIETMIDKIAGVLYSEQSDTDSSIPSQTAKLITPPQTTTSITQPQNTSTYKVPPVLPASFHPDRKNQSWTPEELQSPPKVSQTTTPKAALSAPQPKQSKASEIAKEFMQLYIPKNFEETKLDKLNSLTNILEGIIQNNLIKIKNIEDLYPVLESSDEFWLPYFRLTTKRTYTTHGPIDYTIAFLKNNIHATTQTSISNRNMSRLKSIVASISKLHLGYISKLADPVCLVSPFSYILDVLNTFITDNKTCLPERLLKWLLDEIIFSLLDSYAEWINGEQDNSSSSHQTLLSDLKHIPSMQSELNSCDFNGLCHEIALLSHSECYGFPIALALLTFNPVSTQISDVDYNKLLDFAQIYFGYKNIRGYFYAPDNLGQETSFPVHLFNIPLANQVTIKSYQWTDTTSEENVRKILKNNPGPYLTIAPSGKDRSTIYFKNCKKNDCYSQFVLGFVPPNTKDFIPQTVNCTELCKEIKQKELRLLFVSCPFKNEDTTTKEASPYQWTTVQDEIHNQELTMATSSDTMKNEEISQSRIMDDEESQWQQKRDKQFSTTSSAYSDDSRNPSKSEKESKVHPNHAATLDLDFYKEKQTEQTGFSTTTTNSATPEQQAAGARPKQHFLTKTEPQTQQVTNQKAPPKTEPLTQQVTNQKKAPPKTYVPHSNRGQELIKQAKLRELNKLCIQGNLRGMQDYLKKLPSIDITAYGVTILHTACIYGHYEIVQYLLNANVNRDFSGTNLNLVNDITNQNTGNLSQPGNKQKIISLLNSFGVLEYKRSSTRKGRFDNKPSQSQVIPPLGQGKKQQLKETSTIPQGNTVPAATSQATTTAKSYTVEDYMKMYPYKDYVNNPNKITFFNKDEEHYILTNFHTWKKAILIDNSPWHSLEAYYQAQKFTPGGEQYMQLTRLVYPSQVKQYVLQQKAHWVGTRSGWDKKKNEVMLDCLRKRAQFDIPFRHALKATKNLPLYETSDRDSYWGTYFDPIKQKYGENILGFSLMVIRDEINTGLL